MWHYTHLQPGFVLTFFIVGIRVASTQVCSPLDFRCNQFKCIDMSKKCDRVNDCGDMSDEIDCTPVNKSLALIFTSTKTVSQLTTIQKFFGDPDVYADKMAAGIKQDLAFALEEIASSSRGNRFEALAFDFTRQTLFFSDTQQRTLSYGAFVYNNNTNLFNFNPTHVSDQVKGLAIDWVSDSLYWVDGHYKRICVLSMSLILKWKPIVDSGLNSPQDVAVNPKTGHLFWSDSGSNPKIERSSLDGLDRSVVVPSSRLRSPSTLTFDFQGQKLFWLDTGLNCIGSVDIDGSNINVWSETRLATAASIAIYKNFLFSGDKFQPLLTIYKVTENGLSHSGNITIQGINGIIDMTFFSKSNQPTILSPCLLQNGGCSHFCFTVPPSSRTCQCSVGFVSGPDNINCTIQPLIDDFVIVADTMQRNVFQVRPGTGEVRALLPHADRFPTAVDFDFLHRYVYWVDNRTNAIGKVSLDGRVNDYIFQYSSPVAMISGIAVDPVREVIFCTDSGLGRIVRMSTLGTNAQIFYSLTTSKPSAIAIDVTTRRLFWTDCGSQPAIRRADIADDSLENILPIVNISVSCPSIALDTAARKIFWIDDETGKVWMAGDDGSGKTLLYTEPQMETGAQTSIAVNKDYIFISNSKTQCLTKVDRRTLTSSPQSPRDLFHTPGGVSTSDVSYRFPEPFQDNFLIVVDAFEHRRNLYQIEIESGSMIPLLINRPMNPVAMAFDQVEKVVYWTDVADGFIGKYSLDGDRGNSTIIYQDDVTTGSPLDGLAIDAVNRKLYCSDSGLSPKILEMDLDGGNCVTVVSDAGIKPRALVVDDVNRELYFTDWGEVPGIFRVDLVTRTKHRIIADNMVWPNALAIDFSEELLYWADAHIDRIEMSGLDGSRRTTLVTETNAHYFSIALSPQYIYFTDWQHGNVRRLNKQTRLLSEQKPKIFGKLFGIVFYNSSFSNVARPRSLSESSVSITEITSNPIPTMTNPSPTMTNAIPTVTNAIPTMTNAIPAMTNPSPTMTNAIPTVTNAIPTMTNQTPTMTNPSPTMTNPSPTMTNQTPTMTNPSPSMTNPIPTMTNSTTTMTTNPIESTSEITPPTSMKTILTVPSTNPPKNDKDFQSNIKKETNHSAIAEETQVIVSLAMWYLTT